VLIAELDLRWLFSPDQAKMRLHPAFFWQPFLCVASRQTDESPAGGIHGCFKGHTPAIGKKLIWIGSWEVIRMSNGRGTAPRYWSRNTGPITRVDGDSQSMHRRVHDLLFRRFQA
jgi:hypothetical protein